MEVLYILIPLSLVLVAVALAGFFWAVRDGQFDDLESPALDILDYDSTPGDDSQEEASK